MLKTQICVTRPLLRVKQLFVPTAYRRGPSSRIIRVGLVLDKMTVGQEFFSEYIVSCQLSDHRLCGLNFLSSDGRTVASLEAAFRGDLFYNLFYNVPDETAALA